MYIKHGVENGATLEAGEKGLEKGLLYSANCLLKCSGVRARTCTLIFSSLKRIMKIQFLMFLIVSVTIIQDGMQIAKEEIFGPVQTILKFK